MNVVFVHNHKFRRINGEIYSPGGFPNSAMKRYTSLFGNVAVVGRIIDEQEVGAQYSKIDAPNSKIITKDKMEAAIKEADAVIARVPGHNGYRAVHLAKKYNKKYLVEVVGCAWDALWNHSIKGKIIALPSFLVMKAVVKNAPYAIYVTQKFLQKRYPNNGRNVGISDVEIESASLNVLDKRLENYSKDKKIIIGTLATIDVTYKGQEFVIRAIPRLIRDGINVEYQLAGAGNKERLEKIAKECGVLENVKFLGAVRHDSVYKWLDTIDVYIQPSLLEGLPRSVVEAMSRALPVIASDCGGIPELIDGKFLTDVRKMRKNPEIIAKAIENIIKEDNYKEQAERNYKLANDYYSFDYLTKTRAEFIDEFKSS